MVFGYAGAAAAENKSSLTHVWLTPTTIFFTWVPVQNEVELQSVKSNYALFFMCFLLSLITDNFPLLSQLSKLISLTVTLKHHLIKNYSQKVVDQCYHWSKLSFSTFPILFLHVFYLSLTTDIFPLPRSITVLYPPKFFLLRLEINVTIDLLNSHFLPQTVPLSRLLLIPFLFCAKTTNVQDDAKASFFPSIPSSFQTKIENTNLHRSVPPLLPLQKNPTNSCWERSTSKRPVSTVCHLCQFCLKCSSESNLCYGSLLFLFAE